ncbi:hypothetical protein BCU17_04910 [Vibrio splendidus]|uniref:Uncharacterized protein n=1 Tax=Vibrio splendidus TaxID=29497 RepID=A0A2N7F7W4_VIBSP|nr:hypothetical protein [Vibrio splendidus]PMJ62281.1 hypothetical protein BCU17_04910 [Vibrio splendidus]
MKISNIIIICILIIGNMNLSYAGGGAVAFMKLKPPVIVPDGDVSDWNEIKNKKYDNLVHIIHEESGIEFYTLEHKREEKNISGIVEKNVRSFLLKVPKESELQDALITLRQMKDGKFVNFREPVHLNYFLAPPPVSEDVSTVDQYIKIGRGLIRDNERGEWIKDNNWSNIEDTKGIFNGNLFLTSKEIYSLTGEKLIRTYYPIRNKAALGGSATSFLVNSLDDDNYEYLELTIPEFVFTDHKRRIFITYTFNRGSKESIEISDNLFPSLGRGVSAHAAICDPSCPHDPYEALESFYEDGVSVQISGTGQLGPFLGTMSVTTNFEDTLADVSGSLGNPDVSLELGVAVFNTSNLSAITEGLFASASYDFNAIVGPGVTMATSPDLSVVGLGGTFGITGLPGYNLAAGWGIDGGGVSTSPDTTNDNTSSGNNNSGNGNSDNDHDWGSDHDSWGHDDDHGPSYGGNDDHDWSNDDDDNSGYFD